MDKKLRKVGDLEEIVDTLCLISFLTRRKRVILFIGHIYAVSSDSCESQGSRGNDRKQNRQTKKEELERGELIINQEIRIRSMGA